MFIAYMEIIEGRRRLAVLEALMWLDFRSTRYVPVEQKETTQSIKYGLISD